MWDWNILSYPVLENKHSPIVLKVKKIKFDFNKNQAANWVRNQIDVVWPFHLSCLIFKGVVIFFKNLVWDQWKHVVFALQIFLFWNTQLSGQPHKHPSQPFTTYIPIPAFSLNATAALWRRHTVASIVCNLELRSRFREGSDLSAISCIFQRSGFCFLCPGPTWGHLSALWNPWPQFDGISGALRLRIMSTW